MSIRKRLAALEAATWTDHGESLRDAAATMSPFCPAHPNGTEQPCPRCGLARLNSESRRTVDAERDVSAGGEVEPSDLTLAGLRGTLEVTADDLTPRVVVVIRGELEDRSVVVEIRRHDAEPSEVAA